MANRLEDLRSAMADTGVDLVAIGPGAHMAWLMDLRPHADERALIGCVSATGAAVLMPALEADSVRAQTDLPFYTWADADGPGDALDQIVRDLAVVEAGSLVLDEGMRADHAALVQDMLPGAHRAFTGETLGRLRMRKGPEEFAALKESAHAADVAMGAAWAAMRAGMTEREVLGLTRDAFKGRGASLLFGIVGAGGNGAFPHHQTGDAVLKEGQAVVMDIGARLNGYPSDITRMAIVGQAPDGYDAVHAVVEAAVEAALAAARPGVAAHTVDAAARRVITDAGYGEYFVHRTGHGLGIEVHEPPYITGTSQTVLEEGMVFSIEPGIYLPDRFGIRLEEIVILRSDGPETLSELPRDARIVGN